MMSRSPAVTFEFFRTLDTTLMMRMYDYAALHSSGDTNRTTTTAHFFFASAWETEYCSNSEEDCAIRATAKQEETDGHKYAVRSKWNK